MKDKIQAEQPSSFNGPTASACDEENPFKLPDNSMGRKCAIAALVVAIAAFLPCIVQAIFFYQRLSTADVFVTVEQVGTEAHKRRMFNTWIRDYIAFPSCCTLPLAILLALCSFGASWRHKPLSKIALAVSIILALIAALLYVDQTLLLP